MSSQVTISWNWLNWEPGFTWAKDILPQLNDLGLTEEQLSRCVYVIRANGMFAIQYPKAISPTLYIGEGNFKNRIIQHRNWLGELIDLVGDFSFQIGLCIPRVKNSYYAYRDFEAALLFEFKEIYGCAPLKNAQMENRQADYEYVPREEVRSAIMIGRGVRYHWALAPMKSSPYHECYWKTHEEMA